MKVLGCDRCYSEDAPPPWPSHAKLFEPVTTLVDESHYGVSIACCRACGQRFVRVFTEFISLGDGDDAQYWTLLPVDDAEADTIVAMGQRPDLKFIGSLGQNRRWLQSDYPSSGGAQIGWRTGTAVLIEGF
jgi:hypothetical protein